MAQNLAIPSRLCLAPGPSPVPFRVRQAMANPIIGHLDPAFLAIVDAVQQDLRDVFGTANRVTFPVSGTGSAGMEMSLTNFVEPGDTVVVIRQGVFGQRMAEAAEKLGAQVVAVDIPWGQICSLEELSRVLAAHPQVRLVAVVMAETSTGVYQPLDGWAERIHAAGALFLVDTVTALGGIPVEVDRQGFDIVFSGTQKCLSAPPGLAPFTVNERALERLSRRQHPVPSWYLDLSQIREYWGNARLYHHTAPISMIYGLKEALTIIQEEGLTARYRRHRQVAESLWAGLEAMGLELMVPRTHRLTTVTTVKIPDGIEDRVVRQRLLNEAGIEIAGGLGQWAGKIWRIGVMGEGADISHMMRLLVELRRILHDLGMPLPSGVEALEAQYVAWERESSEWRAG